MYKYVQTLLYTSKLEIHRDLLFVCFKLLVFAITIKNQYIILAWILREAGEELATFAPRHYKSL